MIAVVRFALPLLLGFLFLPLRAQTSLPDHPQPQQSLPDAPSASRPLPEHPKAQVPAATPHAEQRVDEAWPRKATHGDETISMYQPQMEAWEGDELRAYAALAVVGKANQTTKYGVVWFTARTGVDKVNRQVTLEDFQVSKVKFPTMEKKEAEYQTFLQPKLPGKSKVIALDRLEAALAASDSEQTEIKGLAVNNDPPQVIFTTRPSLLVLIDGPPRYRDVGGTDLQLMLNTRATILLDTKKNAYYLNVMDGWLQAPDLLAGPWSYASKIPDDMKEITKGIKERQQEKAPEGTTPPSLNQAKKDGKIPVIYVTVNPGELLVTEGPPQFELIPETDLEYVKNTTANIFRDTKSAIATFSWPGDGSDRNPWKVVLGSLLTGRICPRTSPAFPKAVPRPVYWCRFREPGRPRKR
jgi:hypothetical protein